MRHLLPTKATFLRLASAVLLLTACQKETQTPTASNTPKTRPLSEQEARTMSSANDFGFRTFAALRPANPTENVFISPLSISAALAMTFNGAGGTTKEAMRQTLGFTGQTDEALNQSFKTLFELLTNMDRTVQFAPANSIWHARQFELQAPFVQKNQSYFDATLRGVDFGAPGTKDVINNWVSDKTNGRITSIVDQTSDDNIMFLINAIYFKGAWTYQFDKSLTRRAPFQKEDGSTSSADFMTLKNGQYQYYTDATKQVIDLPYGNGQFSMTLLVPTGTHTVADVTRELSSASLTSWLAGARASTLELRLPKFRLEYKKELSETLTELGMGEAFSNRANFSQMLQGVSGGLTISEVMHKTFLQVDEEGTEAAAVTSVGIVVTSLPPTIEVNRPFVFLIREKSSNAILFIGRLMQP